MPLAISIIIWAFLALAVISLIGVVFGILAMRQGDVLRATRGKQLTIIFSISAGLFFILFIIFFFVGRRTATPVSTQDVGASSAGATSEGFGSISDGVRSPGTGVVSPEASFTLRSLSPVQGPQGQIISLLGSGLGESAGEVHFIDRQGKTTVASLDLPSVCGASYWTSEGIVLQVPQLSVGEYDVLVMREEKQTNRLPFRITNSPPTPSICRADPRQGLPGVTTVALAGMSLGSTPGTVTFGGVKADALMSWDDRNILVRLPTAAKTGTVSVTSSSGVRSNELPFTLSGCTAASCATGETCCADGACRPFGQCPLTGSACRYSWSFSTGAGGVGAPCGVDGSCPAGLLCDATTQTCQPPSSGASSGGIGAPCQRQEDCSAGLACDVNAGRCVDGKPRVIDRLSCTNAVQSPTPYRGKTDACLNALIGVQLSVPMRQGMFSRSTVQVHACGSTLQFDQSACQASIDGTFTPFSGAGGDIGFFFTPKASLAPETWVRVTISGDVRSVAGVALGETYMWNFRTGKSACTVDHLEVTPSRATLYGIGETQDFLGNATAANCNLLNATQLPWTWESEDANIASVRPVDEQKTTATAHGITATTPLRVIATVNDQQDDGLLTIRPSRPALIETWPACSSACRNAAVGAAFSSPMNVQTFTAQTVTLERCIDASCAETARVPLSGFQGLEAGRLILFTPQTNLFESATTYRATIRAGASGVKSLHGDPIGAFPGGKDPGEQGNAYTWTFVTQPTRALCTVGGIDILPSSATVRRVGATQKFDGLPRSSPDACDARGQRLRDSGFSWDWNATQEHVAVIQPDQNAHDSAATAEAVGSGQSHIQGAIGAVRGAGNFTVACQATSDRACGDVARYGVGSDRCCYPRPSIVEKSPTGSQVCRNGTIRVVFDSLLNAGSVRSAMHLEKEQQGTTCAKTGRSWWRRWFSWVLPSVDAQETVWCPVSADVVASDDVETRTTTVTVRPAAPLDAKTTYRVRVDGASMKTRLGVPFASSEEWTFGTGEDICSIHRVSVFSDPPSTPPAPLGNDQFLCGGNQNNCPDDVDANLSGNQHRYRAEAYDKEGRVVQARFTWQSSDASVVRIDTPDAPTTTFTAGTNGRSIVRLQATAQHEGGGSGQTDIAVDVQSCRRPWPAVSSDGQWTAFVDQSGAAKPAGSTPTNFSTFYCRDAGADGEGDDLPNIRWVVEDRPPAGVLKGFLFEVEGSTKSDAIGIRVFANQDQIDPETWYARFVPNPGNPEKITLDEYDALRDGDTVYVSAANVAQGKVYTNMYVLSVEAGARPETIQIFQQLLKNIHFTTTVTDHESGLALRRDIRRRAGIVRIESLLENKKGGGAGGTYPTFPAGSFIPHVTFSTWPTSWLRLAGLLGQQLPSDPVNQFEGCADPYDTQTCWNSKTLKLQCPQKAFAYMYSVSADGSRYTLSTNYEYPGPEQTWGDQRNTPYERGALDRAMRGMCTP